MHQVVITKDRSIHRDGLGVTKRCSRGSNAAGSPRAARALLFLLFLTVDLLLPSSIQAQTLYGNLVGNVNDASGAGVAGSTVVATEAETNVTRSTTQEASGIYRFTNLPPGTYKLSIAAATFGTVNSQGIVLRANTESRFDAQLRPEAVGQSVVVTAAAPELQTDTANVDSELRSTQVQTLVTTAGANMRSFQSLLAVIPGFTPPAPTHSEAGNPGDTMIFNANGMSGSNDSTRIDGVSDIYAWLPESTAYTPSTEAIASVSIVTNSMNAEKALHLCCCQRDNQVSNQ